MQSSGTRQAIVVGGLMLLFGALMLVETFYELNAWIWAAVLIVSGLGVYGIYATARTEAWMLIVSYVLLAIGTMVALIMLDFLEDSFVAVYVLSAIAIPFVVGYLRTERKDWGLLIPAYVLIAVGGMLLLLESNILTDDTVPAYVLLAVALPFLIVFARDSKQWWALIVGGITALVGLSFLIAADLAVYVLPAALILAGGWILVRQITQREADETTQDQTSET
ncbi:MAG: hypothetical protein BMS9Abin28_0160 [Anaerolineae bacterium]|nr:MAG: hypothetical protein BMS9Abin28_0160 [Anaerolineae bacterium]